MTEYLFFKVRKLFRIIAVRAWRHALCHNRVAAGVEHATVLSSLGQLRTILDIGANRGQFTLVAQQCFPDAQIISFEPLPEPAATFRRVFANNASVALHETAIGSTAGEAIIHLSARDDSSSLLPITARQSVLFPGTAEAGTATIKVARLSDLVSAESIIAPALLKLDVQGFELQALAGCEDVLRRFAWIYVECSFVELYAGQAFADAVIAWLRERGFALRGVYHMAYDDVGWAIQADFLFSRTDEPKRES